MENTLIPYWVLFTIMEIENISFGMFIAGILGTMFLGLRATHVLTQQPLKTIYWFGTILSILIALVGLFMPSRETLIVLYINQFITPDNAQAAMDIFSNFMKR